ncbi:sugar-binding protein [Wenyingzhuangia sp. IMCC45467]
MKVYQVNKIRVNKLKITGNSNHVLWHQANTIDGLQSPWNDEFNDKTLFRALWDDENFYFSFVVPETSVYRDLKDNSKASINNSDRVELFFRKDEKLSPYYCLEIDPTPRIMDFKAMPNKAFNFDWKWPENDIQIKSNTYHDEYIVEGVISIKSLKELNLLKDNKLQIGVYRAKYTEQPRKGYEPTWFTWVDPKTKEPNFHIASSFGEFWLLEN